MSISENVALKACLESPDDLIGKISNAKRKCFGGDSEFDWNDFAANASAEEITAFTRAIRRAAEKTGILDSGYRVISNIGAHGHQEVPHLHVHVLGGGPIGRLVAGQ